MLEIRQLRDLDHGRVNELFAQAFEVSPPPPIDYVANLCYSEPAGCFVGTVRDEVVKEINEAGGIHGRKLRMIIEDSAYDPKKAIMVTNKMALRLTKLEFAESFEAMGATLNIKKIKASHTAWRKRIDPILYPEKYRN